jgi:hypothetical protein
MPKFSVFSFYANYHTYRDFLLSADFTYPIDGMSFQNHISAGVDISVQKKPVLCSKISPKLDGFLTCACHYRQSGQTVSISRISQTQKPHLSN